MQDVAHVDCTLYCFISRGFLGGRGVMPAARGLWPFQHTARQVTGQKCSGSTLLWNNTHALRKAKQHAHVQADHLQTVVPLHICLCCHALIDAAAAAAAAV
jgi:hypothetical protein